MKAFRALYAPRILNSKGKFMGYNKSVEVLVLVIMIKLFDERRRQPEAVFFNGGGDLGVDTLDCFTACSWEP